VACEAFNFREIVRRHENCRFCGTLEECLDQFVANQRIQACERIIQNNKSWMERQRARQCRLHPHSAGQVAKFPIERQLEKADQLPLQFSVPSRVKGPEVTQKRTDPHPLWQFLIL